MITKKKIFAVVMMVMFISFVSYIYVTNIHIYDVIDFEHWNSQYINGTNAEGTLLNTSMRDGNNEITEFFFAPGSYAGTFRIGSSNQTLEFDPDQDPISGQYGVQVRPNSNYATLEFKAKQNDSAFISRVQQKGNRTQFTHQSTAFNFQYENNTRNTLIGCGYDTIVGYRCGMDLAQNHIYNSPEISTIWSPGVISGGELTHVGQQINITGGIVELRTTSSDTGTLFPMAFSGVNLTFAVGDLKYIYLSYNAGAVQILTTNSFSDINGQTAIEMYQVHQESPTSTLYIDARNQNVGIPLKLIRMFYNINRFTRGQGAVIVSPSGLNITVTAGNFYYGLNSVDTPSFNTITGSTIEYYYRNGSGGFNTSIQSYVNNTVYDSGTGTPTSLLPNHYKTEFVFLEITSNGGDNMAIILGQDEYVTLADAEQAPVPEVLPTSIAQMGVLIGRVIVKEGTPTIISVESAFQQQFQASLANQHNTLAGLDGGQVGFYGHSNASEADNISKIPLKLNISDVNLTLDSKLNKSGDSTTGSLVVNGGDLTVNSGYYLNVVNINHGGGNSVTIYGHNALLALNSGSSNDRVAIGDNNVIFPVQQSTLNAPAFSVGGIYYDTTLKTLMFGDSSFWNSYVKINELNNSLDSKVNKSDMNSTYMDGKINKSDINTTVDTKVNKSGDNMTGTLTTTGKVCVGGLCINSEEFQINSSDPAILFVDYLSSNSIINYDNNQMDIYVNNHGTPDISILSSGDLAINKYAGTGTRAACFYSNGTLFASTNASSNYVTC